MIAIKFLIILLSLVFFGYMVFRSLRRDEKGKVDSVHVPTVVVGFLVMIAVWVVGLPAFGQIPAGYRGVVLEFGKVTNRVLGEGLYVVTPFVNSVVHMNVQVHADKTTAAAASRDLQNVSAEITVNYRLNEDRVAEVYRDLRNDYVERVMAPAIQEAVKSVTAQYDAERLIAERPVVKNAIEKYLSTRLAEHGMIVDGISITDFDFSPSFNAAIEAKVTATQEALKAKNDLERVKMEAEQRIAQARAEAEAIRIQAAAVTSQGGKDYVALKAIEKWNGTVPQWVGTGNAIPFVSMGAPPAR